MWEQHEINLGGASVILHSKGGGKNMRKKKKCAKKSSSFFGWEYILGGLLWATLLISQLQSSRIITTSYLLDVFTTCETFHPRCVFHGPPTLFKWVYGS